MGRSSREPEHSYLDFAAVGQAGAGRYIAGTAIILFCWLIVGGIFGALGQLGEFPIWLRQTILLLSFIPLIGSVLLVVRFLHDRPWRSVITPFTKINPRLIARGLLIWVVILAVVTLVALPIFGEKYRFTYDAGRFWPLLLVVVLLTFIQTSAEEVFFRGYLSQWLALGRRNIWLIAVVNGVLFTLVHLANPEVLNFSGTEFLLATVPYFAFGFVFAWVSVTSGSIELALGAHFINNVAAFLVVSQPGSPTDGATLFTTVDASALSAAVTTIVVAVVFWLLTRRVRATGTPMPVAPAPS